MTNTGRKKVYIITQHYPYGCGEKTFIEPELKELVESKKFDITILCNANQDEKVTSSLDETVTTILIPNKPLVKRPWLILKFFFLYFFLKEIKSERKEILCGFNCWGKLYDSLSFYIRAGIFGHDLLKKDIQLNDCIIYTYWCNVHTLAIALLADKLENIKLISRIHGFDLYDERVLHGRQPFRKIIDSKLNQLFFIAQTGMEYYVEKMGEKSKYILNRLGTVNENSFSDIKKAQKKSKEFLLISCSNMVPLKRVEYIIQALSQITEFDIKWIHFGDGILRKTIEEQAGRLLNHKRNISYCFKGETDNKSIMEFYRNNLVDCFITTSETEGCPVTLQEAMSYGIPIIGTEVGEIPLMIQENGILLKKDVEIDEISKAIKKIYLMEEDEKELMRNSSRKLWEKYFNGKRNHDDFIEKLLEI